MAVPSHGSAESGHHAADGTAGARGGDDGPFTSILEHFHFRGSRPGHAAEHEGSRAGSSHTGHAHGSASSHSMSRSADRRYLWAALGLLVGFLVLEVVVAVLSSSVALLADAGHMLTDAGALAGALWAGSLAQRPARGSWTFGYMRAEVLSATGRVLSV